MFATLKPLARMARPREGFTPFLGGLDIETPAWLTKPGALRDALNYEIAIEGGYRDITGYERFDGRPKPSDASFTILDLDDTSGIGLGDVVTGSSSGASGVVIAIDAYPDDPDQGYIVITKVTGQFTLETLGSSAQSFDSQSFSVNSFSVSSFAMLSLGIAATVVNTPYADNAPTAKLKAQYKNLAADEYRADIHVVPGEGVVWGGFSLGDTKYAIRNKVGGATAGLYYATPDAGWFEVDLGREVAFTAGSSEIKEGNTIVGQTSGAVAFVRRVQILSGDWSTGDAAGYFTTAFQTGAFQSEYLTVVATTNAAHIAGDTAPITLRPNGRLDHVVSNFADPQGPKRVYGADGVNFGFEFDGSFFARVRTGMAVDRPRHVAVHKNKLFFSFGASVQHSGDGDPMAWEVVLGAAELVTNAQVSGFQVQPGAAGGAALLVATKDQHHILYGNDVTDWNLVSYREKIGAYEWTLQTLAKTLFLDQSGITDLQTIQAFGNFGHAELSNQIRRLVNAKRLLAVASCAVTDKGQYRLFFSDKTAIYATFSGTNLLGMMPVTLNHVVNTIWAAPDIDGTEEVFFGSDDGFVYQMERGTSFDGDNIEAFLFTHFDFSKTLQWQKDYFGPVTIETAGRGYAEFDVGYALNYGLSETVQPNTQTAALTAAEVLQWDTGITFDAGSTWDQSALTPTVGLDLRGEGQNVSWAITKSGDYFEPLLLSGVHFKYLPRRQLRG
jgi:hypothetical protein